ncbi:MAG: hypothetical protein PWP65_813 [Clostridia bacterium]|nr:hypothetical protein [Clostridia bacterium]
MLRPRKLTVIFLLLAVVLTSGCGLAQRFGAKSGQPEAQVQVPEANARPLEKVEAQGGGETRKVVLYFADPTGQRLVAQEREIPKVEGIARATIQELIKGPGLESNLLPTIPAGTVLKDINIRPDGLARVDFSRELVENHSGGSIGENLTVYSIVNTLTQFPSVKKVEILVEGKKVKTLAGHVDVSDPITRNENIIAKQ